MDSAAQGAGGCPKCHARLAAGAIECARCGIVIAKYLARAPRAGRPPAEHLNAGGQDAVIADLASSAQRANAGDVPAPTTITPSIVGRAILLLLLTVWTTTLVGGVNAERVAASFLHLPNLVFHEAGHFLFAPFGRFMTVLGGSLTQVLVPLVCAGAFLWQTRDRFAATVAVWWAGENLLDLAPYINDARDLQLVLLGGRTGAEVEGHDWEYLLNAMGIAHRDHAIASVVQGVGTAVMVGALMTGALVLINAARRSRPGALPGAES